MDTKPFLESLEKEKKFLEEELSQIAVFNAQTNRWEATPDQSMVGEIDENDAADRFEDFEGRSGKVKTFQERLNDITDALEDIAQGTYGNCKVGEPHPIEADRLQANPAARTCKSHM